ncbi:hypothetical protein BKI52_31740 [marine bacterium AO1-C]|nr:hypothetical protein BKI52_31740 [marine bacterium AO1-C]
MLYKLPLLVFTFLFASPLMAQKYQTNNAKVVLDILVELKKVEPGNDKRPNKIRLGTRNDEGTSEFDAKTGQIQFSIPINAFKFEKKSFQKSFQASPILKAKQHPFVTFKGRIVNYKKRLLRRKNKTSVINIEGGLTIRGVTKPIKVTGNLSRLSKAQVAGKASFTIPDASLFASNGEEQKGLTEEIKISVDAKVEVTYEKKANK